MSEEGVGTWSRDVKTRFVAAFKARLRSFRGSAEVSAVSVGCFRVKNRPAHVSFLPFERVAVYNEFQNETRLFAHRRVIKFYFLPYFIFEQFENFQL